MLGSLKEYLCAVFCTWFGLIAGTVGGTVSVVLGSTGLKIPWWGYILAVFVPAYLGASFQAFHKVRLEMEKLKPEGFRPDWEGYHVYKYLEGRKVQDKAIAPEEVSEIVAHELRQAASDGEVWVWGRPPTRHVEDERPFIRIEPHFWHDHGFDLTTFFDKANVIRSAGLEPATTRADADAVPEMKYRELRFNKAQVMRHWPTVSAGR